MGPFGKRGRLSPTAEERAGEWTRGEIVAHWKTLPDRHKLPACMAATDDQLRVLAWVLTDAQDRFVALNEARQRRALPEVRKKAEEAGEMEPEDLRLWIAPLQQMQGRRVSPASVDRMYKEFFGPELI